jgi:hypothetical protein
VLEYPLSLLAVTVLLLVVARPSARDASARASAWTTWALAPAALGVLIVLLMAGEAVRARQQGVVARSRNFFGSVHVMETVTPSGARVRTLIHGTTVHGLQILDRARDREPTAYYVRTSGVGLAMEALRSSAGEAHVGVVGLGTGTLAAYSRPLDRYRFYEIDPQVVALSQGAAPLFTYLVRSGAEVTVVTGDARLGLEREAPQQFDVLVVDAFSSDAVPAHLLTVEAFALYRRHLRDDSSLLLLHISNRFLRLADVVQAGGAAAGFASVLVVDAPDTELARASDWMLLALDPDALRPFAEPGPPLRSAMRPWTDGWASLFDVIRW